MTVDPGIAAAENWTGDDPVVHAHLAKHGVFQEAERMMVEDMACLLAEQAAILAPLYAVWSETKPPCPTCGGRGHVNETRHRHTNPTRPCDECPDGVQPFNNWVAGLAASLLQDWSGR